MEYEKKRNEAIFTMEVIEKEKLLKELDEELAKEIAALRESKLNRAKSSTSTSPFC